MNAIHIQHVTKHFGKQTVLASIDLAVEAGEIFTLLGENGAGKSTLINILTTLSSADSGDVTLMGLDIRKQPQQVREHISYNAQTNTLDDEFTGYENLLMIAQLRGIPHPQEAVSAIAQRLHMQEFLSKKVAVYSGGMRRRVDIAMSLLGDPAIIFLDEPTTGIDPKNRLAIWDIIRELKAAGKTIFLTTQYLEEADQLSDHIAFLHNGTVALYGTPAEIKHNAQELVQLQVADDDFACAASYLQHYSTNKDADAHQFLVEKRQLQEAIQLLAQQQITIERIMPVEARLEDVFLHVTEHVTISKTA